MNRLILGFFVAAAPAACTTAPAPTRPSDPPHTFVDGLDVTAMVSVFTYGFTQIKARAYEEPAIDAMFADALTGLSSLDPALKVRRDGADIVMDYAGTDGRKLGTAPDNIASWSEVLVQAIVEGRKISPLVASADDEALYQVAFNAVLPKLDPFSRYVGRRDAARNRLVRDGVIGLGLRVVAVRDGAFVDAIVHGGPGDVAGVKINDTIIAADGAKLARQSLLDIRRYLDGSSDTLVSLTLTRIGVKEPITVMARRDLIVPDTVVSTLRDGIAELRIKSFNQRTAIAVSRAIAAARVDNDGKLKGVLLDFRGDPGGLLDQAVDIADLFLENGAITSLKGRHPASRQFYAAHRGDIAQGAPIAILVDGKTASAAEIVAAALQDNARAVVVGTVSLGKGSVQTVVRTPNGGEIAITWSHATSPRGTSLHGLGVLPDVCLSGAPGTLEEVTPRIGAELTPPSNVRLRWSAPNTEAAAHESQRAACAAESHPDRDLDLDVARLLLRDPVVMARATAGDGAQIAVKP